MSLEALRSHVEDAHWGNRLQGFETMLLRLTTTNNNNNMINGNGTGEDGHSATTSHPPCAIPVLPPALIEACVDLAIGHLGDPHQRVAGEAMSVLGACIQGHTTPTSPKLGAILTALFHRLADRRAAIKGEGSIKGS